MVGVSGAKMRLKNPRAKAVKVRNRMETYNSCQELSLDDLVRVDVIEHTALGIPVPPTVPMLAQLSLGTTHPLIVFSAGYSQPMGDEGRLTDHFSEIDENNAKVTLKSTKAKSALGNVYAFDLQIAGVMGKESGILPAIQAERDVQERDFSLVLRFADGTTKLCYFLEATSSFAVEQNTSADSVQATIKIAGKSLSNWIEVVQ